MIDGREGNCRLSFRTDETMVDGDNGVDGNVDGNDGDGYRMEDEIIISMVHIIHRLIMSGVIRCSPLLSHGMMGC